MVNGRLIRINVIFDRMSDHNGITMNQVIFQITYLLCSLLAVGLWCYFIITLTFPDLIFVSLLIL